MLRTALAVASALVALAFGLSTFERYLLRRSRQYAAWTAALGLFVLGALALAWGSELGWSSMSFRLFYAAGAVANVPLLAAGQVYLLARKRTADVVFALTAVVVSVAFGVVLADPFTAKLPVDRLPKGDEVFRLGPRIMAAVGSGGGATVLVIGTVIGIIRIARSPTAVPGAGRRTIGLALLSVGTFVLSASGLFNSVLGEMSAFAVTLMIGIAILFAGFLLSTGNPRTNASFQPGRVEDLGDPQGAPDQLAAKTVR